MESLFTKLISAGVLGIITLITGVLLSNAGRPLNAVLFNLHKIISVATVVLIIVFVIQLYKAGETKTMLEIGMIILTILFFIALVATGGMLSFEREWPAIVLKIHQVLPLVSLAFSAISSYMLIRS
jgi:hypothetical protein